MVSKEKKSPGTPLEDSGMAEISRRFKANPFVFVGTVVVLVIVVIAFVFVPAIVPEGAGGSDFIFGYYNKTPIAYARGNYFDQAQQSLAQQYQSSMDESNAELLHSRVWLEAFETTVVQTGILDEMKRAGYTAPRDVVDREVASLPDFQTDGVFSKAKYDQLDNNRKMVLWRQVRDSVAIDHYVSDVIDLRTSSKEKAFIRSMENPQRRFDMVSFPMSSYPDSEITAYVQANPALFRVTHLSKITVSSEREARELLASIQNGTETFEDAAKNKSADMYATNSGDMGSRMVFELETEIPSGDEREGVLNLEAGTLSAVAKISDTSWALFRCEEKAMAANAADPAVVEKVRGYILGYERGRVEDWLVGQGEQFVASVKAADFDSAVMDRGMTKKSFGPLPLNYGDAALFPSVSAAGIEELRDSAATSQSFWQAAFSTPVKTPSTPVVLGSNVVVLYPLEETSEDSGNGNFIEIYYSYWLSSGVQQNFRSFFMNSEKLDNRFWPAYESLFF